MRLIYCIINNVNGKRYVGQTKNLARRKKQHFSEAPRQCDHPMARAVRKYGRQSFTTIVIEECEDDLVDDRERHWIAEFQTNDRRYGYNCDEGGNACKTLTAETRLKIGESRRRYEASMTLEARSERSHRLRQRRKLTSEELKHASDVRKGVPKSAEHKAKIAAALKGAKHPPDCRCKVHSLGQRRRLLTDEQVHEIAQLRASGFLLRELMVRYDASKTTIQRALRQAQYNTKA